MCDVLDRIEKMGGDKREEKRNVEVATDLINAGQKDASFIARISRLPEDTVRQIAKKMGAEVL